MTGAGKKVVPRLTLVKPSTFLLRGRGLLGWELQLRATRGGIRAKKNSGVGKAFWLCRFGGGRRERKEGKEVDER